MSKKEYLIETLGRKEIVHVLTTSAAGPSQAIADLQGRLGLHEAFPELTAATPLLDLLHVGRNTCNKIILDRLITSLLADIPSLPQEKLLTLLSASFRYITVYELRCVPFIILESLRRIPEVFLRALAQPKLASVFRDLTPSIKRQVWEVSLDAFRTEVGGVFAPAHSSSSSNNSSNSSPAREGLGEDVEKQPEDTKQEKASSADDTKLKQLCSIVGSSSKLFACVCDLLAARVVTGGEAGLSSQLRAFLLALEVAGHKIAMYGKLFELASTLQEGVASKSLNLGVIVSTLRAIITSHLSRTAQSVPAVRPMAPGPLKASTTTASGPTAASPVARRPRAAAAPKAAEPTFSENASLQEVIRVCLDILSHSDASDTFSAPVTDDVAPGYSGAVATPMDLSTMRSKVDSYQNFAEFEQDIELICSNCILYNGKNSYYGVLADKFLRSWRGKRVALARKCPALIPALVPAKPKPRPVPQETAVPLVKKSEKPSVSTKVNKEMRRAAPKPSDSIEAVQSSRPALVPRPPGSAGGPPSRAALLAALERAWDILAGLDPTGVYASPVSDDIAPRYSEIIKQPMDLSTMQAKLHRYRCFTDFEADARLLWDNCHLYNGPDSYYSKLAIKMERLWRPSSRAIRMELGEEVEAEEAAPPAAALSAGDGEEEEGGEAGENDDDDAASSDPGLSESSEEEADEKERRREKAGGARKRKQVDSAVNDSKSESESVDKKRSRVEATKAVPRAEAPKDVHRVREVAPSEPPVLTAPPAPVATIVNTRSASLDTELTATEASSTLLWAIALLRDPAVQHLLHARMARVLHKISSEAADKLPCDDVQVPVLLQLIQLPAIRTNVFAAPDPACLRRLLPLMITHHLVEASPDLSTGGPPLHDFAAMVGQCSASSEGASGTVCDPNILYGAISSVFDYLMKLSSSARQL